VSQCYTSTGSVAEEEESSIAACEHTRREGKGEGRETRRKQMEEENAPPEDDAAV